jgi:hypothetical protein
MEKLTILGSKFLQTRNDKSKKQNEENTYMKTISSKQVANNLASKTKTNTQEDFVKTMKGKNMIVHEL